MDSAILKPGDVVRGLDPKELVQLTNVSVHGQLIRLQGVTTGADRHLVDRYLTEQQVSSLVCERSGTCRYDGDAQEFLLGTEAERIRTAYQFDPLFAVSSSIVDPLPHQIEAVYEYLLKLPRIRFLLADDTGAGKTIMTGLLIKELKFRGAIQRILIITPGGLTRQWQDEELGGKFGFEARLVNGATFEADPSQFSTAGEAMFVTSIDFLARNNACLNAASGANWDLIVVDEAHKLSAVEYGSKVNKTARYQVVERLGTRTDHLLFLTATPHRGSKDGFRRLLMLLDEDIFHTDKQVEERVLGNPQELAAGVRNRYVLRRLKEQMVDWEGEPLFRPRYTETVAYELSPPEKELYDAVTQYVRAQRRQTHTQKRKNLNVELILMVMQRRLASSLYAITRTLENRETRLTEVLSLLTNPLYAGKLAQQTLNGDGLPPDEASITPEDYEDLDDDEREKIDDRILRQVLSKDPGRVAEERDQVHGLVELAHSLSGVTEAKFEELLHVLDTSDVIRDPDAKLVIFTEYKDTLHSLVDRLKGKGYTVTPIDGSMDVDQRKEAQREFRRRSKILVATDAAGEGINLQFCQFMINWDIPWNPNRLEQRMGRIHRYGQKGDVHVWNLVAANTREGTVLQKVLTKLDVMREQLGTDRVYDVISDLFEGVSLVDLIKQALDSDGDEAANQTERAVEQASQGAATIIEDRKEAALSATVDLSRARGMRDASDEQRLQPLFVQRFFQRAWTRHAGTIQEDTKMAGIWSISTAPQEVIDEARMLRLAVEDPSRRRWTFDKALMSPMAALPVPEGTRLMGPGNAMFDALLDTVIVDARTAFTKGVVLIDPSLSVPQRAWLVRSTVLDSRQDARVRRADERLMTVIHDTEGFRELSPSYFLDCVPGEGPVDQVVLPEVPVTDVEEWTRDHVTLQQMQDATERRQTECGIVREYLTKSFTQLINDLQQKAEDLDAERRAGEPVDDELERLDKRIAQLKTRRADRLAQLDLMENLVMEHPTVLAEAIILPAPQGVKEPPETPKRGIAMQRDDEVEATAMRVAQDYERTSGWAPKDISRDGLHYDLLSEASDGQRRFIEVKGRADDGDVMLTEPELNRLSQLGVRAWLYVVTGCKAVPVLHRIQDPGNRLRPVELYRSVQYLVNEQDWKARELCEQQDSPASLAGDRTESSAQARGDTP